MYQYNLTKCYQYGITNNYITHGSNGIIYACTRAKNCNLKLCAKEIRCPNKIQNQKLEKEIQILQLLGQINNPNLIRIHDIFYENLSYYIVMDYCEKGDLYQQIENMKKAGQFYGAQTILEFIVQFCSGYQVLYDNNILHRDIKPSNLLISNDNQIKITDFGSGRFVQDATKSQIMTLTGTTTYMAPQVQNKKEYSAKADMYSFAICLLEMIMQKDPSELLEQHKIKKSKLKIEDITNMDKIFGTLEQINEILFIINSALEYEEKDRMSWTDLFLRIKNKMLYKYQQNQFITHNNLDEIRDLNKTNILIKIDCMRQPTNNIRQLQILQKQDSILKYLWGLNEIVLICDQLIYLYKQCTFNYVIVTQPQGFTCYMLSLIFYRQQILQNIAGFLKGNYQLLDSQVQRYITQQQLFEFYNSLQYNQSNFIQELKQNLEFKLNLITDSDRQFICQSISQLKQQNIQTPTFKQLINYFDTQYDQRFSNVLSQILQQVYTWYIANNISFAFYQIKQGFAYYLNDYLILFAAYQCQLAIAQREYYNQGMNVQRCQLMTQLQKDTAIQIVSSFC